MFDIVATTPRAGHNPNTPNIIVAIQNPAKSAKTIEIASSIVFPGLLLFFIVSPNK